MPKDKNSHALATQKCNAHSYHPYSSRGKGPIVTESGASVPEGGRNDWKDTTCPICLESPHNAVLLSCSSRDKGCRPYMCNTSYRHSNCLDQYRKANLLASKGSGSSREHLSEHSPARLIDPTFHGTQGTSFMPAVEGIENVGVVDPGLVTADMDECMEDLEHSSNLPSLCKASSKGMTCPLCRGKVSGWRVVEAARECLNRKARNCAQESCTFMGTYEELRVHARREHPFARPSAVDPARQRDWRRLEQQRDIGDVLSSINSAMPTSATIFGDYVVEEDGEDDESADFDFPGDEGHWWTVFLLFQAFGPTAASIESSRTTRRPRLLRGLHHRDRAARLSLLRSSESQDADANGESNDSGEQSYGSSRRRRRRLRSP